MWVKICGVQDAATVNALLKTPPDAVGFNFFRRSKRYVDPNQAQELINLLPDEITPVGVFVNSPLEEIESICGQCGITTVQIHGDEAPEFLAELQECNPGWNIIRAWGMGETGLEEFVSYFHQCRALDVSLWAGLIDARVPGLYGGTGKTVAWNRLAEEYEYATWPPLILAGGLTVENVAQAIRETHPWGVDVASGVENADGKKLVTKMRDFVRQVRSAEN